MSTSRDLRFDGLKALLIFLVVLGHLDIVVFGIHLNKFIYSFHMPVFVFLSGYFTPLTYSREKQINWIKKTFFIFILAQLTQILLELAIGISTNQLNGNPFIVSTYINWRLIVFPKMALWYLVCLIYWRFAYWRLCGNIKDRLLFAVSLLLVVIAGFVPLDYHLSFQRAFAFFPFFVLGILFKKQQLMSKLDKLPISLTIAGLIIGFIVASQLPTYLPISHFKTGLQVLKRLIQTGLGFYMSLLILRLSRCHFFEVFSSYGSKTLWIYIGHVYLVKLGNNLFPFLGIQFNLFSSIVLAVFYCALILFVSGIFTSKSEKSI